MVLDWRRDVLLNDLARRSSMRGRVLDEVHIQRMSGDHRILVALRQGRLHAVRVEDWSPGVAGQTRPRHVPVAVLLGQGFQSLVGVWAVCHVHRLVRRWANSRPAIRRWP